MGLLLLSGSLSRFLVVVGVDGIGNSGYGLYFSVFVDPGHLGNRSRSGMDVPVL